ncbi:MAG: hypothetical protein ACOY91_01925 [Pseudomonadota bacterium]|jgi:hypothetical protein
MGSNIRVIGSGSGKKAITLRDKLDVRQKPGTSIRFKVGFSKSGDTNDNASVDVAIKASVGPEQRTKIEREMLALKRAKVVVEAFLKEIDKKIAG